MMSESNSSKTTESFQVTIAKRLRKARFKKYCAKKIPPRHHNTEKLMKYILDKFGMCDTEQSIYVCQAILAQNVKCNVRTIRKSIRELEALGLIQVEQRRGRENKAWMPNSTSIKWESAGDRQ